MRRKEHIRLFEWLTLVPVIISLFEMVPTKGVMTGTITNFFDWTTEVTNFNFGSQTVGYSPFTTTNLDDTIVWTRCDSPPPSPSPPTAAAARDTAAAVVAVGIASDATSRHDDRRYVHVSPW